MTCSLILGTCSQPSQHRTPDEMSIYSNRTEPAIMYFIFFAVHDLSWEKDLQIWSWTGNHDDHNRNKNKVNIN
jgi:hypothetical protein